MDVVNPDWVEESRKAGVVVDGCHKLFLVVALFILSFFVWDNFQRISFEFLVEEEWTQNRSQATHSILGLRKE